MEAIKNWRTTKAQTDTIFNVFMTLYDNVSKKKTWSFGIKKYEPCFLGFLLVNVLFFGELCRMMAEYRHPRSQLLESY